MIPKVRLIDVAKEAGVSRVSAGHVLLGSGKGNVRVSEDTTARVLEAGKKLGYQPNRSAQRLRGATGNLIGAIVRTNAPAIERDRLVALERVACKRGYQLLISAMPPSSGFKKVAESTSALSAQGAAGVIILTAGSNLASNERNREILPKTVYFGIPPTIGNAPGVVLDLAHGYQLAVKHLAETGRRRIAVLNVDIGGKRKTFTNYRLDAIKEEAESIPGLKFKSYLVPMVNGIRTPSVELAEQLVDEIVADKMDAIMAFTDTAAARMIQTLTARGLCVPDDVAVCGLNNLAIADLTSPPLTTIDERSEDIVNAQLDLLLEQIENPDKPYRQLKIKPKLIIRKST